MGWTIRRSKGLFGGLLKINMSKSGLGFSAGVKGARIGIDAKGRQYSQLSIPHTGIYNRQYHGSVSPAVQDQPIQPSGPRQLSFVRALLTIGGVFLLLFLLFVWFIRT